MLKRIFIFFISMSLFISCKNEEKKDPNSLENSTSKSYDQNDGLITLKGDFIFLKDAAVLQTSKDIYGVVIDEKMHELNTKIKSFKNETTDMVPVTVRVKKFPKPEGEEGWPFRVEIKEILKVEAPNPKQNDVIKIENKDNVKDK